MMVGTVARPPMGFTHSVAIATLGRPDQVHECIQSLAAQTVAIEELILADDTPGPEIEDMVPEVQKMLPDTRITYIRMEGKPSLTRARNAAKAEATGHILSFFDSDVVLAPDYLAIIQGFMEDHPEAAGCMGWVEDFPRGSTINNLLTSLLLVSHATRNTCRLRYPLHLSYPIRPVGTRRVNWLFGCNMTWRRDVYRKHDLEPGMERYSYGEDLEFSLRVAGTGLGPLYFIPEAVLSHSMEEGGRMGLDDLFLMRIINRHLICHRHRRQGPWLRAALWLSDLGDAIFYTRLWGQGAACRRAFRRGRRLLRERRDAVRRSDFAAFADVYSWTSDAASAR